MTPNELYDLGLRLSDIYADLRDIRDDSTNLYTQRKLTEVMNRLLVVESSIQDARAQLRASVSSAAASSERGTS